MADTKPPRKVLMVGPDLAARGGVASVCSTYAQSGMFSRMNISFVSSFEQGRPWRKLWVALLALWHVWLQCARQRAAVVHVHSATNMSFWRKALFYVPARLHGIPFVMHLHSGDMPAFIARCSAWQRRIVLHLLEHASTVIVLSPEWADWLKTLCPKARIAVLPNPVSIPAQRAVRRSDGPSLLFLGRLIPAKGFPELVHAVSLVRRVVPDVVLMVGGEGDMAAAHGEVAHHGVQDCVKFLGWVDAPRRAQLLSECWVFVLPSHHEGLPVGILEAMAHGMPFVATPVGAVPGLVRASEGGRIVPVGQPQALAEALIDLLTHDQERDALGANSRRHARQFYAVEVVESKLQLIYASVAHAREASKRST